MKAHTRPASPLRTNRWPSSISSPPNFTENGTTRSGRAARKVDDFVFARALTVLSYRFWILVTTHREWFCHRLKNKGSRDASNKVWQHPLCAVRAFTELLARNERIFGGVAHSSPSSKRRHPRSGRRSQQEA